MPRYDYHCPANDRLVEVSHGMSETLRTWGDVCDRAGIDPGDTPRDAEVTRPVNRSVGVLAGGGGGAAAMPEGPCGPGGAPPGPPAPSPGPPGRCRWP